MEPQALGLTHFWAQADAINRAVGLLLLAMSVVSWTVMLGKLRTALALRGGAQNKLQQFWAAPALADGVAQLRALDPTGVFAKLAQAAEQEAEMAYREWIDTMLHQFYEQEFYDTEWDVA